MNFNKQFPNQEDKNDAVGRLKSLRADQQWQFFVEKFLKTDMEV